MGKLKNQPMKILPWDDQIVAAQSNITEYRLNKTKHSTSAFKLVGDPMGWAVAWVTKHKYKLSWGNSGLDFEKMTFTVSERWHPTDNPIFFIHNFTDVREDYKVKTSDGKKFYNGSLA